MRKFLVGASAAAALALIAGCASSGNDTMAGHGAGNTSTPASTSAPAGTAETGHNADDITFAQQMIPHHAQAVEMAKLVPSRSQKPEALDLASRIQRAQAPEIQQLTAMLTKWGSAPASAPSTPGMEHGSGGHSGAGMMTADEMKQLEAAKGAEFDRMWMQMMIKHHEGAIEMARTELSKGSSSEAKMLAQKVIDAQQAEITEMQSMLK